MDCMIKSPFWDRYLKLVREQLIPYQWGILTDRIPCETESHAVRNFQIAAGVREGEFSGFVFQDSDLYKWIEAAAYSLKIWNKRRMKLLAILYRPSRKTVT